MKATVVFVSVLLFWAGCSVVRESTPGLCPYTVAPVAQDRLRMIQSLVRAKVHISADISISGPYIRDHLDWLAAHGRRDDPAKKSSSALVDAISPEEIQALLRHASPNAEVYFWQYFSGSGFPNEATGFVAIEKESVVGFVETFHAG